MFCCLACWLRRRSQTKKLPISTAGHARGLPQYRKDQLYSSCFLGRPRPACFQSGPNLYCDDRYRQAVVSEYCREEYRPEKDRLARILLKSVTIAYRQTLLGTVSEVNVLSANEHLVRVGPLWYRILKIRDEKLFDSAVVGSVVSLTTFGCAANELVCEAVGADGNP